MSKYVKDLITRDLRARFDGVSDCVVVDVVGMDANTTFNLRRRLRKKNISLMVVKNTLARRASSGSTLAPAFEGVGGTMAVCWGGSDFVELVKEIEDVDKSGNFAKFVTRGGVLEGEQLTPDRLKEISKWPSREEQLSLLVGQILGPGATLAAQLLGPGGTLAGQIKSKGEEESAA